MQKLNKFCQLIVKRNLLCIKWIDDLFKIFLLIYFLISIVLSWGSCCLSCTTCSLTDLLSRCRHRSLLLMSCRLDTLHKLGIIMPKPLICQLIINTHGLQRLLCLNLSFNQRNQLAERLPLEPYLPYYTIKCCQVGTFSHICKYLILTDLLINLWDIFHLENLIDKEGICVSAYVNIDGLRVVEQINLIVADRRPLQVLQRRIFLVIQIPITHWNYLWTKHSQYLIWRHYINQIALINNFINGVYWVHYLR